MSHQLIVAIGRESGSGGLDIAHALAERLQLPLFDKSILQKAAEDKAKLEFDNFAEKRRRLKEAEGAKANIAALKGI